MKKRAETGDATAMYNLGGAYCDGSVGLQQDYGKAVEFWLRAGELGCAESCYNIATLIKMGKAWKGT